MMKLLPAWVVCRRVVRVGEVFAMIYPVPTGPVGRIVGMVIHTKRATTNIGVILDSPSPLRRYHTYPTTPIYSLPMMRVINPTTDKCKETLVQKRDESTGLVDVKENESNCDESVVLVRQWPLMKQP
eukprot:scaffold12907_cov130-Amphora_coffeaeformis.AAC.1